MNNNQPRNQPYSNRETNTQKEYTPDPARDEYIRQNERTKANHEAASSALIGIGIAVLLALGIGFLVWPTLFKPNNLQAPTVGPEQTESNTPKNEQRTQEPQRNTVIIERNRTQVVPVPVTTPNVNVTVPPVAPQAAPNVNVTVPPAAPQAAPNADRSLPETNPKPTSDPSVQPPKASDTNGSGGTEPTPTAPVDQPQSHLNPTTPDELVSTNPSRTGNSSALFKGRRD